MGEVVVVPFGTPDLTAALNVTSMLEAELSNERVALIPLHDARDRFTARSRPPQTASDSDLDVLAREARQAIEHVAFGRTAAAQKSVRDVITRAERTLESLNRETATARHILDACLSLVRTTLQAGKRDLALEQATRCRRLVPDLVPSETAHPANVVGVLAEADNLLRRMRIGNLTVRSAPESGCAVYLNGRHLGTTPFQLDRAAAGDYRVQVECNRTLARVHVVQLGDQAVSMLVDTQFDRAIASDPRLLFRYESADHARERAVSHAVQLGREVHADDVVLVGVANDRAELLRVQVSQQRLVGRASVPWTLRHGFSRPALEAAIVALSEARLEGDPSLDASSPVAQADRSAPSQVSLPITQAPGSERGKRAASKQAPPEPAEAAEVSDEPAPELPETEAAQAHAAQESAAPQSVDRPADAVAPTMSDGRRRRIRRTGYSLLGVSAALFAVGIGYDMRAQSLQDKLAPLGTLNSANPEGEPLEPAPVDLTRRQRALQSTFETSSDLRWLGVGAGAVATLATALLVAPRERPSWWSYTLAGVGVALVAVGARQVAISDRCDQADGLGLCRRPHDSKARGALLISAAIPLLSVPLVQLFKRDDGRSLSLSSRPLPAGVQLELHAVY